MSTVDRIYDNTKDGIPNYAIQTTDGKMLYARGMPLYPVPKSGDVIKFSIVNTKTSERGNQYSNIKDVEIEDEAIEIAKGKSQWTTLWKRKDKIT